MLVASTGGAAHAPSGAVRIEQLPATLRPHRGLLTYYVLGSLLLGPLFVFVLVPAYFRYHTLRYELDEEGITMRWGILFRREVSLTYARIQDIQLSSNVVERWLRLAKIQLQTASGSSTAEMTVEGIMDAEALRDFLYARMRGTRTATAPPAVGPAGGEMEELTAALNAVAAELRALRTERAQGATGATEARHG